MKLYHSPTSPYVRKVMVCAKETGVIDRIQLAPVTITPVNLDDGLNADNPLGKVPCLVSDDGMPIFDSRLICEYIDSQHDGPKLIPADGTARWRTQRIHALCDGILDAGILSLYELRLRPEEKKFDPWFDAQQLKIKRGVAALADDAGDFGDRIDMATIAAGVTLAYLDFRFTNIDWRADHPVLAEFYGPFSERASMQETVPKDP